MTKDEIIAMAKEAGMEVHESKGQIRIGSAVLTGADSTDEVTRFAALVAAKEREACAQECVAISVDYWMGDAQFEAATRCCNAIRARGTKEGV